MNNKIMKIALMIFYIVAIVTLSGVIYLAMKNTNTIYPDRIKKALDDFKTTFSTWLINEGIDPNLI